MTSGYRIEIRANRSSNTKKNQDIGVFDKIAVTPIWPNDDNNLREESSNETEYNLEYFAEKDTK